MKFKDKPIKIGTRFYNFVSEDEFQLIVLVKNESNKGTFMDEETFETFTLTDEELDRYTMIIPEKECSFSNFRLKKHFKNEPDLSLSLWINEENLKGFLETPMLSEPYEFMLKINFVMYKYMSKKVFDKMFNYIIHLSTKNYKLTDDDYNILWQLYFNTYVNESILVLDMTEEFGDKLQTIDDKLPDAIIDEAEICLGTAIMAYDVYEYDVSVDMSSIEMKYFMLYINDKYYIVTYKVDVMRQTKETQKNLREHNDLVSFMLK